MKKVKQFFIYFFSFSIVFYLLSSFIPIFRQQRSTPHLIIQTLITAAIYGFIMLWVNNKKGKNEKK
ncbi:MAG: hypothetical protein R6U84_03630 [Candidatus Cloacimonadales bacterium]